MQKLNLSRKLFDFEEQSSDESTDSVIYISSDSDLDLDWFLDRSADQEDPARSKSSPMPIGGRVMTTEGLDEETTAGPSSSQPIPSTTVKFGLNHFDKKMCSHPLER